MNEEILKKLEQRMNRRTFLKGSSLAVAALAGAAALPRTAFGQDQQAPKEEDKKDAGKDEKAEGTDTSEKQDPNAPVDETKITRKDENGREYRICPQCGSNMYRQNRTWTCENCGYSYTE